MGNKKIVGTALSCLMLLNSAFNVTYAANTEIKNVNHSSQETKNKILKYGTFVVGCLTAIGGLICADYNYFSDIKYPLIFDFNSKSGARGFDAEQMISEYQKLGKEFFVITQIEESEYVIQYFSSNGNIFSEMKISKSELNCLLSGSCKIPRKSGVYSGTKEIFEVFRLNSEGKCNSKIFPKLKTKYKFTLTAIFYDSDEKLEEFTHKALKGQYVDFLLKRFPEDMPNDFEKYEMNTFHTQNNHKIITKFIPIDSRKLKSMSPSEYEKVEERLKQCTSGIIIFDYSNSELDKICEDVYTEDCKEILEKDITMNYVFRLIRSVSWGNFLGCYTYNESKMTKKQIDDRFYKFSKYVEDLEEDRVWNICHYNECVERALDIITCATYSKKGLDIINQREPFAKKYIEENHGPDIVGKVI